MQRLAVALLGGLLWACAVPSRAPLRAPDPPPQIFTAECGGLRVQFTVEQQPRSAPRYEVSITDLSGQPLAEVVRVILAFTSAGKDISTTTVVAQPKGAGRYGPPSGFTVTAGAWKVEAIVRRAETPAATCAFYLNL
jgi:hypothetical protein